MVASGEEVPPGKTTALGCNPCDANEDGLDAPTGAPGEQASLLTVDAAKPTASSARSAKQRPAEPAAAAAISGGASPDDVNVKEDEDKKCGGCMDPYFGWPHAKNNIGDNKVLWGKRPDGSSEKPVVKQYVQDCLAGTTVAMILVPEAVAFAFMAGLKPAVGLQAAWIMCLTAALVGDRPGSVRL